MCHGGTSCVAAHLLEQKEFLKAYDLVRLLLYKRKKSSSFDKDRFSDIRFRVAKVNKSVVYNYVATNVHLNITAQFWPCQISLSKFNIVFAMLRSMSLSTLSLTLIFPIGSKSLIGLLILNLLIVVTELTMA